MPQERDECCPEPHHTHLTLKSPSRTAETLVPVLAAYLKPIRALILSPKVVAGMCVLI